MAQIEKNEIVENHEQRENVRLDEYRPISVKDLKAGICRKATMLNYSKNGMYFETDSILQPGTKIFLGIDDSSGASFVDEYECKQAKIIWRKKIKKSFYKYGYGIKLISADNTKEQTCESQRDRIHSRNHPRKPYIKSVLYAANSQILDGRSQNISLSGIFIKTKDRLSVGQTIILSLPSKTKKKLKMKGEVVWFNNEGFGIKFLKKLGK